MSAYDDLPPVADVRTAAAILGVSDDTIYGLVHSGQLGHVRLGRCIRIPRHRLVEFLAKASAGPARPTPRETPTTGSLRNESYNTLQH